MSAVVKVEALGFPWQTIDPFLFCVHHDDAYPRGNAAMGPDASLAGRDIGQDFAGKDGWRMYHGQSVPGFPAHPHRGFETVTIVRRGLIDHADSLGATARFGGGDVQWLTAGEGIVHSEMFPLIAQDSGNPLELFQIWLNLPSKNKMVRPHFTMLWSEALPRKAIAAGMGELVAIAGAFEDLRPLPPPPDSWASAPQSDLAIWTIRLAAGARWTLPAAAADTTRRRLYFFKGDQLEIDGRPIAAPAAIDLAGGTAAMLAVTGADAEFLLLQGRSIAEPVAQYGPFVMNTQQEIQQAFADYRRTQFGGWPWPHEAPVHPRERGRFARHADGREESREGPTPAR